MMPGVCREGTRARPIVPAVAILSVSPTLLQAGNLCYCFGGVSAVSTHDSQNRCVLDDTQRSLWSQRQRVFSCSFSFATFVAFV
jgi:hypothetical protein